MILSKLCWRINLGGPGIRLVGIACQMCYNTRNVYEGYIVAIMVNYCRISLLWQFFSLFSSSI